MLKPSMLVACALGSLLCAAHVAIADDAKPAADSAHHGTPNHACLRDTGSRIPLRAHECQISAGRSYSKQDIDRTGATTASGALRLLDPSMALR